MAVLVTMEVGPVDWEKFRAACQWADAQPAPGFRSRRLYQLESDPRTVLVVEEWDSHDTFHAASEKYGKEFNTRAGTERLEWRDHVWVPAG